jgi:hypothetical protein
MNASNESIREPDPPAPEPAPPSLPAAPVRGRQRYARSRRVSAVGRAAKWVLWIGILQLVVGIGFGVKNSQDVDAALKNIARFEPDDMLELADGSQRKAADLRADVERERLAGFAVPIGIGMALLGLYVWARRSPLPALVSALCLFVLVHGVSAVLEPKTLVQGLIVKFFFIAALIAGIKAALAERELAAQPAE